MNDVRIASFDDTTDEMIYPTLAPKGARFAEVWASFHYKSLRRRVIPNKGEPGQWKTVEKKFAVTARTLIELRFKPLPKMPGTWRITWLRE